MDGPPAPARIQGCVSHCCHCAASGALRSQPWPRCSSKLALHCSHFTMSASTACTALFTTPLEHPVPQLVGSCPKCARTSPERAGTARRCKERPTSLQTQRHGAPGVAVEASEVPDSGDVLWLQWAKRKKGCGAPLRTANGKVRQLLPWQCIQASSRTGRAYRGCWHNPLPCRRSAASGWAQACRPRAPACCRRRPWPCTQS